MARSACSPEQGLRVCKGFSRSVRYCHPRIKSTNPTETPRVASRHLRGALDPTAAVVVPAAPSVGRHAVRHRIGSRATQPASQLEGGDRAIVHAACVHPCEEAAAQWPL